MYFFNVYVIRNVLKRFWRKIYIFIFVFSFILFSFVFVLIFCFLFQKIYFGFWEYKWGLGGGRDLEKSFFILYVFIDIFLDEFGLKLINFDSFFLYNFIFYIYILCIFISVVLLVYLYCWKILEGFIIIYLYIIIQNFIFKFY